MVSYRSAKCKVWVLKKGLKKVKFDQSRKIRVDEITLWD